MINNFGAELAKCEPRTNQPGRINVPGMERVEGKIQKEIYEVQNADYADLMALIKKDVLKNYSEKEAQNIIETVLKSENKLFKEFDKNWLIFANNNGSLSYFGFLKRKKEGTHLVGIYEFRVNFTLQKDIYIRNQTSYSHSSSFFGGSSSKYVSIDYLERKSRGICEDDIKMLCQYADLMEMEFKEIQF